MKALLLAMTFLFAANLYAQEGTQTIRGTVRDEVSKSPVIGTSVLLVQEAGANPVGAVTDIGGDFSIPGVPVGRQSFQITMVGYEPQHLSNIVVTAGKEVVLNVTMTESVQNLDEVVVTADRKSDKTKTNNELSLVSGRSFQCGRHKAVCGGVGRSVAHGC